jgi:Tfp pilus assembly protein PilF
VHDSLSGLTGSTCVATKLRYRFQWSLGALLLAGLAGRLAYVAAQSRTDPWFLRPPADGADVLAWARELVAGQGLREGAFYAPPLYPYLVGGLFALFGENLGLLYYLQHVMVIASAGLLAIAARRLVGEGAALATCALVLLYQPLLYFGSRPVGEPLGILLLSGALAALTTERRTVTGAAGLLTGLAAVARPNLALAGPLWAAGEGRRRGVRAAGWLLAGFLLALVPTTVRNYAVSGHFVPVSANAGLTFYHGNGPGATGFIREPPALAQTGKGDQRRLATWVARQRSGEELDAVEADRWWGRQALRERLEHPGDSLLLLLRRASLLLWNAELTLDGGPRQDPNPLRWLAPLPFCVLIGLSAAGLALAGVRGTGGSRVWAPIVAGAAAPLLFYISSRYRLPMAAMLCLPAGAGLSLLVRPPAGTGVRRRVVAVAVLLLVVAGSLAVPGGDLLAQGDAAGLVQRGRAWRVVGDLPRAEADFRLAVERNPGWAPALFYLAEILDAQGRGSEAERLYRETLRRAPGYANAACYLGQMLNLDGRYAEAEPLLRRGLQSFPYHEVCWNHLVGALIALGRSDEAVVSARQAIALGVPLDPAVQSFLEAAGAAEAGNGKGAGPGSDSKGESGAE